MLKPTLRKPGDLTAAKAFLVSWLCLSLLSVLWSLATPISAAPDEPAHIVKAAAVVRGEFVGDLSDFGNYANVPSYIAWTNNQTCYARLPAITASCIRGVSGEPFRTVQSTTTAGQYNPVYYMLVGWPSLIFHNSAGVFAIRFLSGILSSFFLALAVAMVSTWRKRALPLAALLMAITPMVLFLNGVVNPNSLEIAGTLATFVGMMSLVSFPDRTRLVPRVAIIIVSASIAVNTRALSPVWVAVALVAPVLLIEGKALLDLLKTRVVKLGIAIIGASTTLAGLWMILASVLSVRALDPGKTPAAIYPNTGSSPLTGFALMIIRSGEQFNGMIGYFGWIDTAAPVAVYVVWYVMVALLIFASLVLFRARVRRFALALLAVFVFFPAIAQGLYIHVGGFIWQGRYTLTLFSILIVGLATALAPYVAGQRLLSSRRILVAVLAVWGAAQVACFIVVLRRYVVGIDHDIVEMLIDPRWQPPGGVVVLVAMFTFVTVSTIIFGLRWRPDESDQPLDARIRTLRRATR